MEARGLTFTLDQRRAQEKLSQHLQFEPEECWLLFAATAFRSGALQLRLSSSWNTQTMVAELPPLEPGAQASEEWEFILKAATSGRESAKVQLLFPGGGLSADGRRTKAGAPGRFTLRAKGLKFRWDRVEERLRYSRKPVFFGDRRVENVQPEPCLRRGRLRSEEYGYEAEIQLWPGDEVRQWHWVRDEVAFPQPWEGEVPARIVVWDDQARLDISRSQVVRDARHETIRAACLKELERLSWELVENLLEGIQKPGAWAVPLLASALGRLLKSGRWAQATRILESELAGRLSPGDPFREERRRLAYLRQDFAAMEGEPATLESRLFRSLEDPSVLPDRKHIRSGQSKARRLEEGVEFLYWAREELRWGRPYATEHFVQRSLSRFLTLVGDDHPLVLEALLTRVELEVYLGRLEQGAALVQWVCAHWSRGEGVRERLELYRAFTTWRMGCHEQALEQVRKADLPVLEALILHSLERSEEAAEILDSTLERLALEVEPSSLDLRRAQAEKARVRGEPHPSMAALYDELFLAAELVLGRGRAGDHETMRKGASRCWERLGQRRLREQGLLLGQGGPAEVPIPIPLRWLRRPYRAESEYWAQFAGRVAGFHRSAGSGELEQWLGRAKSVRQTRAQVRVTGRGPQLLGGQKFLRWACELTAPARRLTAVTFHSSRGTSASSDEAEPESLLLMKDKAPLGRDGKLDLRCDSGLQFHLLTPEQPHASTGLVPFQLEFHFSDGPPHRCWPTL